MTRAFHGMSSHDRLTWGQWHKQPVLTDNGLDIANLIYIYSLFAGEPAHAVKIAVFGGLLVLNLDCKTVHTLHLYEQALSGTGAAGPEPRR